MRGGLGFESESESESESELAISIRILVRGVYMMGDLSRRRSGVPGAEKVGDADMVGQILVVLLVYVAGMLLQMVFGELSRCLVTGAIAVL